MNKKLQHITDAFSVAWTDFQPYMFPPFCLIARVLNKIETDNVDKVILILPFGPLNHGFLY